MRKRDRDGASRLQDELIFGEYGDVNPSVCDSSTFTFLHPQTMRDAFEGKARGCFLYSRHWNPTTHALAQAIADLELTEASLCTASGMAAITTTLLAICGAGHEIVASRTIYGGTYAFLANLATRFGIKTTFVDANDLDAVKAAMNERVKVVYCEAVSNPLLEVADLAGLAELAHGQGAKLVVDNTFSPLLIAPTRFGADVVVHSLTKFMNGTSDCIAGAICASADFIESLMDVNSGVAMLLGPVLDSRRAAGIHKNLHSLHLRMRQHSENAMILAKALEKAGAEVHYPGLESHAHHERLKRMMTPGYGFGGMLTLNVGTRERADQLMIRMQEEKVGYLAVSLGFYKTLFSAPGHSTSSEIPSDLRAKMGLGDGIVRFSVGLDHDMKRSAERVLGCLKELDQAELAA